MATDSGSEVAGLTPCAVAGGNELGTGGRIQLIPKKLTSMVCCSTWSYGYVPEVQMIFYY